jgi:NAD(P)-dependent dehydrogenase (short-subunit alcohol dehydrogenase family)
MNVKDRVVLVAGAATDSGAAISQRLAKGGATVILADSDKEAIASLEKKIAAGGDKAKAWKVNMSDEAEVSMTVQAIAAEFGSIDVLINCMDKPERQSVSETSVDHWKSLIDANLTAVFLFSKAVIPKMKEKKYGRIVNLNDFDYLGMRGQSSYSAVKAGIFGLTRALALELAAEGITVNAVVKGEIKAAGADLSEEQLAAAEKRMPVGRIGTADDIAYAVSHFASSSSKYITGQTLFVCGGKSLYASMSI